MTYKKKQEVETCLVSFVAKQIKKFFCFIAKKLNNKINSARSQF